MKKAAVVFTVAAFFMLFLLKTGCIKYQHKTVFPIISTLFTGLAGFKF